MGRAAALLPSGGANLVRGGELTDESYSGRELSQALAELPKVPVVA